MDLTICSMIKLSILYKLFVSFLLISFLSYPLLIIIFTLLIHLTLRKSFPLSLFIFLDYSIPSESKIISPPIFTKRFSKSPSIIIMMSPLFKKIFIISLISSISYSFFMNLEFLLHSKNYLNKSIIPKSNTKSLFN